jgi:hypothetical protein
MDVYAISMSHIFGDRNDYLFTYVHVCYWLASFRCTDAQRQRANHA